MNIFRIDPYRYIACRAFVLILVVATGFLFACSMARPPSRPLDGVRMGEILNLTRDQTAAVKTLYYSGNLVIEDGDSRVDAHILLVAEQEPLRLKIEVTHVWGRPIAHARIQGHWVEIVSFSDKRVYQGDMREARLHASFPIPLQYPVLWSLARAYPVLENFHQATSESETQITLRDQTGMPLQVMEVAKGTGLPGRVWYAGPDAGISFGDFQERTGLFYAQSLLLKIGRNGPGLTVRIREMVLNPSLPGPVFELEGPAGFQMVPLGRGGALSPVRGYVTGLYAPRAFQKEMTSHDAVVRGHNCLQ